MPPPLASLLAASVLWACAAQAEPLAVTPLSRDLPWWQARHVAKLTEARGGADVVLLGDSITQQWERTEYAAVWQRYFGARRALDLGFDGDATSHLLWRIEHGELAGLRPRAAVILIGANNLGRLHWAAADDVAGIVAVVEQTRQRLPDTPILLLGVLPSDRGPWVAAQARAINTALGQRYTGGQGVRFADPSPLFLLPDGRVATALYRDRPPDPALHPSPEGMARLAGWMEPVLARWLGDQPR